jgi:hypothetical protein
MFEKNQKRQPPSGQADGGAGRGIPLGGHDDRPPTGYLDTDVDDRDFGLEEDEDPADRRKDPLRR